MIKNLRVETLAQTPRIFADKYHHMNLTMVWSKVCAQGRTGPMVQFKVWSGQRIWEPIWMGLNLNRTHVDNRYRCCKLILNYDARGAFWILFSITRSRVVITHQTRMFNCVQVLMNDNCIYCFLTRNEAHLPHTQDAFKSSSFKLQPEHTAPTARNSCQTNCRASNAPIIPFTLLH